MAIDKTELTNSMNQFNLNSMNTLLGSPTSANVGPLSGDIIQSWSMRGPNSAAYRKLLEAQETGSVKKAKVTDYELQSEKFFKGDEYVKNKDGKLVKITDTYKPEKPVTAADGTLLSQLDALRNIASAAASSPSGVNGNYQSIFETMRQNIANALVTKAGSSSAEVVSGEARAAKVTSDAGFRYLDDTQQFTVAGGAGEKSYSFSTGASLNNIADAINADSASTGVKAEVELDAAGNAVNIALLSTDTGKNAFVRVDQTAGDMFAAAGTTASAAGTDATTTDAEVVAKGGDAKAALATGAYGGKVSGEQQFSVSGSKGSKSFTFAAGTGIEDVVDAINAASGETGVAAGVIRNAAGEIEGLGLESTSLGQHEFVKVEQDAGYLFAAPGQKLSVYGKSENPDGANAVNSLAQFGQVKWGGETYSFADLGPGGRVNLDENGDLASAIIEQALSDVYSGNAVLNGVDLEAEIADHPYVAAQDDRSGASSPANAMAVNDFGSQALAQWVADRVKNDDA